MINMYFSKGAVSSSRKIAKCAFTLWAFDSLFRGSIWPELYINDMLFGQWYKASTTGIYWKRYIPVFIWVVSAIILLPLHVLLLRYKNYTTFKMDYLLAAVICVLPYNVIAILLIVSGAGYG